MATQHKLLDDLLNIFGGHTQTVMARLIESGRLTLEDVEEARNTILKLGSRDGKG